MQACLQHPWTIRYDEQHEPFWVCPTCGERTEVRVFRSQRTAEREPVSIRARAVA